MNLRAPVQASSRLLAANTRWTRPLLQPHAATKQRAQPFSTKPLLYPTQSPHREDIRGVTCGAAAPMMEQPETYDEAGQPRGYRRNVGVCLLHPSGKVFVARCKQITTKEHPLHFTFCKRTSIYSDPCSRG